MSRLGLTRRTEIVVDAPASSANVGPGFDVFAIALDFPFDRVSLSVKGDGLKILLEGVGREIIPTVVKDNTAGVVALSIMEDFGINSGLEIKVTKGVPVGMGLGSSAASAAAVAFGINKLFNLGLDNNSLVLYASKGEVASAGKPHADNVAASLLGGFTLVRSYCPMDVMKLDPPENLGMCIASPVISYGAKKTEQFRAVIPKLIELDKLVKNVGNASALVSAVLLKDLKLFGRSLNDTVVEPARAKLIPGYFLVKEAALKEGALGVTISGAGPSMVAFFDKNLCDGKAIGSAMCESFNKAGVESSFICTSPGKGARVAI
ncbi:MAG: homoserine kinase [Nitrososphaeria archaeon]